MFRVLFDGREVERRGPNFHYSVRIIIKKKEKKKKERKCGEKGLLWAPPILNFFPSKSIKKYIYTWKVFLFCEITFIFS